MNSRPVVNEKDLLARARRWEKDALVEIYDLYSPGLYRYAMRQLNNQAAAEDCVAESFERLLKAFHRRGGPQDHLQAYLYRVAHNWVSDYYRRAGPESVQLDTSLQTDQQTENAVLQSLEAKAIRQAMALLTPEQRQVIALKHLEGLRNAEVAEVMGKSVGAVKALEQRGLAGLERTLQSTEDEQRE